MSETRRQWEVNLRALGKGLGRHLDAPAVYRAFARLGGEVEVSGEGEEVVVDWRPSSRGRLPLDVALTWLTAGDYDDAMLVLSVLHGERPEDPAILYNLGMAFSDQGAPDRAVELLEALLAAEPEYVNGRVALGVAQLRLGRNEEARQSLEQALAREPENLWAHRNLASALVQLREIEKSTAHFREAVRIDPRDAESWVGLGQALEWAEEFNEADSTYLKAIEIAGFDDIAEVAQKGRSRIAQQRFRERGGSAERMDAVMYCLDAMERFGAMGESKMRQVVMEIALLGRQGLDVNDASQRYQLRSLAGNFSGLQLVSMMYVGFKQIQPEADVGFDLSKEYETALAFRGAEA